MSEWGVTKYGFKPKDFELIERELQDEMRAKISASLQFNGTIAGQLTGIFSHKLRDVWELAASVYTGLDPDVASGSALTSLASLTGTVRKKPAKSSVLATVKLAGRTTLPKNSIASVVGNSAARFFSTIDVINTKDEAQELSVIFQAEKDGPTSVPPSTLTVIDTPVTGWLEITNGLAAEIGRDVESDVALRLRRHRELRAPGSGTLDSIKAKLAMLTNVRGVLLLHNDGNVTDANGLPAHSLGAVVLGASDEEIARIIWQNKPTGINTHGTTQVVLIDSQGQKQEIRFSRPDLIALSLDIRVKTRVPLTAHETAGIKKSIVDYTTTNILLGDSVFSSRLYGPIFSHKNIVDVVSLIVYEQSLEHPFKGAVAAQQYADFDVSRIHIHEC